MVLAVLAAGCATPHASHQPTVSEQTDVWFAQHMVPHLLQDTSIAYLTRARLTDPALVRLANRIHQRGQAQATQLLEWLAQRGLAPHGHSHLPGDTLRRSDLEQLSRLDGAALDWAFVKVVTARDRAGNKLATTEARTGGVPAIRQLAQQLLAEEQARTATLQSWIRFRWDSGKAMTSVCAGHLGVGAVRRHVYCKRHLRGSTRSERTVRPPSLAYARPTPPAATAPPRTPTPAPTCHPCRLA